MHVVVLLLLGLVVGALACLLAPGHAPRAWAASLAVGAAGAMVGGVLANVLAWNGEGDRLGDVVSIVVAAGWVGIYRLVKRRSARA